LEDTAELLVIVRFPVLVKLPMVVAAEAFQVTFMFPVKTPVAPTEPSPIVRVGVPAPLLVMVPRLLTRPRVGLLPLMSRMPAAAVVRLPPLTSAVEEPSLRVPAVMVVVPV